MKVVLDDVDSKTVVKVGTGIKILSLEDRSNSKNDVDGIIAKKLEEVTKANEQKDVVDAHGVEDVTEAKKEEDSVDMQQRDRVLEEAYPKDGMKIGEQVANETMKRKSMRDGWEWDTIKGRGWGYESNKKRSGRKPLQSKLTFCK